MTEQANQSADDCEPCQKPSFRGCIFCYSAEWGAYVLRRLYRSVAR
jgi:hypothetical protein